MTQSIEIVITLDGRTRVQSQGFAGESCRAASRFVEEALGIRLSETLTAEFHQQSAVQQPNQQQR